MREVTSGGVAMIGVAVKAMGVVVLAEEAMSAMTGLPTDGLKGPEMMRLIEDHSESAVIVLSN